VIVISFSTAIAHSQDDSFDRGYSFSQRISR
jgi:hypothetical protein